MDSHQLALKPGYVLEHFRIESVLGKGGFGITYLAVDLRLGKRVAIKELLPDTIATRAEGSTVVPQSSSMRDDWQWAKDRFMHEAKVLAGFSHPAIVGVHLLIEANGTVYMVMDYIEGESYESRLRRVGIEPDEPSLLAVIGPILDGLEEVHAKGLLHRDIKPDNILIDTRGQPVLIDFGAARESVGKTVTMTSIVTHGYSPIEQYQSKGKMGPWTDIYAVGAVMCRAITGEKPPVAADRVMDDEFLWLGLRESARFSERFRQSVDWALQVKPQGRPQQIRQFLLGFSNDSSSEHPNLLTSQEKKSPTTQKLFPETQSQASPHEISMLEGAPRLLPWIKTSMAFAALALAALLIALFFAKSGSKGDMATASAAAQVPVSPKESDRPGTGDIDIGNTGSPEQLYERGVACLEGKGRQRDESKGIELLTRAGEGGLAKAQVRLGHYYRVRPQQVEEAVRWYRKAADQGSADAQIMLGRMYELLPVTGGVRFTSIDADDSKAARWYRDAAEQGDPEAQYRLGLMYELGRILTLSGTDLVAWSEKCKAEAMPWYRKAAAQGHPEAMKKLN